MIARKLLGTASLGVAATVLTTACISGTADDGRDSAPGSDTVLTMANFSSSITTRPPIAHFVNRFRELSSGVSIKVVNNWGGLTPNLEQQVIRDVAAGKADLGWVGTRVFDTLGVTSFQALSAPMLIDSYALQQAVVGDDISQQMLDGLGAVGVRGLALLAGGLRKPVSVKSPLLRPSDWRGATFATFRSVIQSTAIEALGATAVEMVGQSLNDAVDAGSVDGFEVSLRLYQSGSSEKRVPYVAANVSLWPEMLVLVVNPDRFGKLSDRERAWLMQAATDIAARSAGLSGGDATVMAQECELGTRFGVASTADLTALRDAFAPVYAKLGQDATTKRLMARIEELKRATSTEQEPAVPTGCGVNDAGPTTGSPTNPLVGTWEAASPHPYLLQVTQSMWVQLERHTDGSIEQGWRGTYTVNGSTITLTEIGFGCELEYHMTLQAGELRIKVIRHEGEHSNCGPDDLAIQRHIYETAPFHKTT